ncbi:tRNA ligase class I, partial [Teladorsagia circumcincta]
EALGVDKLEKQLTTDGKVVHVYWGTATTGKPHVGYFVPMRKIADFLQAGLKVESPLLSGLLYPLLQALDEQYLKVDGQFGGVDQRKIFILAEEQLPKLKLGKRWHLMNPMVPGLTGSKMSSSEIDSKIDLLDSHDVVERKILGAACSRQETDNGVLAFFNYVLIPIVSPNSLVIADKEFFTYDEIKESFLNGTLSAEDLKKTLIEFLNELLAKVQDHCKSDVVREALEKGYKEVNENMAEPKQRPVVQVTEQQLSLIEQIVGNDMLIGDDDTALRSCIANSRAIRVTFTIHPKGRFHLGFLKGLLKMK